MVSEVIGIDHIYISVTDIHKSESYYDILLSDILGFKKNSFALNSNPHIQYFNRHYGFVIRQARTAGNFDPESPGIHHFCFRVLSEEDVDKVAAAMRSRGLSASIPQYHKEYAPDYYAIHFTDPDGLKLEVTNFREERRDRMNHWETI